MSDRGAGRWGVLPLLMATLTTTTANTVVNVPMAALLEDLSAPLSSGVLVATAFTVPLAMLMPVSGWLGDRLGRRRVLCAAMLGMALGSVGAACAQNLPQLVAFRLLQGVSAAPTLPVVMALVVEVVGPRRRGRALSMWAAANGAGQALGPTLGGLLAGWAGWRAAFWPLAPVSVLVALGGLYLLPRDGEAGKGRRIPLDLRGAGLLTAGSGALLGAAAFVPTLGAAAPPVLAAGGAGVLMLLAFVLVERGRPQAFLRPRHLVQVRFLRSALAAGTQMFTLGAVLLAVPLHLVQGLELSTEAAGFAVLALPLTMAALAPLSAVGSERFGGRPVMRTGLVLLLAGQAALAVAVGLRAELPWTLGALALTGTGVALVQTPAAAGASRSDAGHTGAGIGLFNLIRFGGTAMGAACVGLLGSRPAGLVATFTVCAALVTAALAFSYVGRDPSATVLPSRLRHRRPAARG